MKRKPRTIYTNAQKAVMWDRCQKGESLHSIAHLFDRTHQSVRRILAETGGIRPPPRKRSRLVLTLSEREEISRSIVAGHSIRSIATELGRSPSTVSRELHRNGGRQQAMYNSDHVPAMIIKIRSGKPLSDEELVRYEHLFRAFNRNMDNQLWQYNHEFLGENIPYSIRRAVRFEIAGHKLGIAAWDEMKRIYSSDYVTFVDDAISDLS